MGNKKTNSINNNNEVKFTRNEEKFLLENEVCRVATIHNDIPHITPVTYIYENGTFFIATDYNTRKFKNLKVNKNIALAVDVYNSSVENKAVVRLVSMTETVLLIYQKDRLSHYYRVYILSCYRLVDHFR
jgi:nitroimidazol reductase NimA-like FMN-containing flavoprotein (pyridoxamine 5'-phosphate oxidase superfamily)